MSKIRLLFLVPVDAENLNAQSLNVREIAPRLDSSRFECTLLYCDRPDPRLSRIPHIALLRMPRHGKTPWLLRQMLSGYDLIAYMDYSPASYLFLRLPRAVRRATTTMLHAEGQARIDDDGWLARLLYNGVAKRCDTFSAITDWIAHDWKRVLSKSIDYVLPVGVDCKVFAPPKINQRRGTTVLFVGALLERKGTADVLHAADHYRDIKFRLIGAGRYGSEKILSQKITATGLTNVSLEGPKHQSEIVEAMQKSDVLLLPSRSEGLPKVTLEAAATGLPCIVFRDYKTPSVVDTVTGFQVETREGMIDRLGTLLADSGLRGRMGIAARKHAESFDWNKISVHWEEAYLAIAGSGRH